jgi:hypothetical protein
MRQRRRYRRTSLETCTSALPLILDAKSKFIALKSTKSNDYSQSWNCCYSFSKCINVIQMLITLPIFRQAKVRRTLTL